MSTGPKPLQFGPHGELTIETINSVDLSPEERERAVEMLEVQRAYIDIFETLEWPVDPEGGVYDLTALGPTVLAVAWTLALNGFRRSGTPYIKKRAVSGPGVPEGAITWVDVRAPDAAEDQLQPQDSADDVSLPPDVRMLAARRDGAKAPTLPTWDGVKPRIEWIEEPRPGD